MHVHIASTGTDNYNVLTCLNYLSAVDVAYLMYSGRRKHAAEDLKKKIDKLNIMCEMREVSGFNFQEIHDTISGICNEYADVKNVRYTVNITGGTNLMAAAACSAAFYLGAELYYVMYDRDKAEKGLSQDPVDERVVRIPMSKIPNLKGLSQKTKEILEYISNNEGPKLLCSDVAEAFGMTKQALKYHTDRLRAESIIETEKYVLNRRKTHIILTDDGRMVSGWIKNFNVKDKKASN